MEQERITQEIKELFEKLSVSLSDIEVKKQGEIVVYNIITPESGMMIGRGGEHLRALNYLISLMLSQKNSQSFRFNLDINNYRQNEINEMMAEVRRVADEVLRTKEDKELGPMTSYERLMVHNLLTDDVRIETESTGEGKERRIVIKYCNI